MRVIRFVLSYIGVSVFGILSVLFLALNRYQVRLDVFGPEFSVNLAWVMAGAAAIGFFVALLILVPGHLATTVHAWTLGRDLRQLEDQLAEGEEQHARLLAQHERLMAGHERMLLRYERLMAEHRQAAVERDQARAQLAAASVARPAPAAAAQTAGAEAVTRSPVPVAPAPEASPPMREAGADATRIPRVEAPRHLLPPVAPIPQAAPALLTAHDAVSADRLAAPREPERIEPAVGVTAPGAARSGREAASPPVPASAPAREPLTQAAGSAPSPPRPAPRLAQESPALASTTANSHWSAAPATTPPTATPASPLASDEAPAARGALAALDQAKRTATGMLGQLRQRAADLLDSAEAQYARLTQRDAQDTTADAEPNEPAQHG